MLLDILNTFLSGTEVDLYDHTYYTNCYVNKTNAKHICVTRHTKTSTNTSSAIMCSLNIQFIKQAIGLHRKTFTILYIDKKTCNFSLGTTDDIKDRQSSSTNNTLIFIGNDLCIRAIKRAIQAGYLTLRKSEHCHCPFTCTLLFM